MVVITAPKQVLGGEVAEILTHNSCSTLSGMKTEDTWIVSEATWYKSYREIHRAVQSHGSLAGQLEMSPKEY